MSYLAHAHKIVVDKFSVLSVLGHDFPYPFSRACATKLMWI